MSGQQLEVVFDEVSRVSLRHREGLPSVPPYGVLVRTRLSLVSSGTETMFLYDPPGSTTAFAFPFHPNAALIGEILRTGDAVRGIRPDLQPGKRVLLKGRHQSYVQCDALNEQIYVPPEELSDEEVLLARQAIIGVYALEASGVRLGTPVHVVGLGIVGQLFARLAVVAGARPVSVTDHHPSRRRIAASNGVVQVEMPDHGGGGHFSVVAATCGSASAIERALERVASGGTVVLIGAVERACIDLAERVFRRNVRILGAHEVGALKSSASTARWSDLLDLPIRLIRDGSLNVADLMTHSLAPSDCAAAYAMAYHDKDNCLGIVFDWRLT